MHGPLLVVAGVLIHADTQWRPIGEYLKGVLDDATPKGAIRPTCLHATDIYYGAGEFPKAVWLEMVRFRMLDEMAQVPWLFGMPSKMSARDYAAPVGAGILCGGLSYFVAIVVLGHHGRAFAPIICAAVSAAVSANIAVENNMEKAGQELKEGREPTDG